MLTSIRCLTPEEVGYEAEDQFLQVIVSQGARIVECPNGKSPGAHLAIEPASGEEDVIGGVDFWLYISQTAAEFLSIPWSGGWIPIDLTVANGADVWNRKCDRCAARRVVLVGISKRTLDNAVENGSAANAQRVWEATLKALREWLPRLQRLGGVATRQSVAERVRETYHG